jgi:hypothetical protein
MILDINCAQYFLHAVNFALKGRTINSHEQLQNVEYFSYLASQIINDARCHSVCSLSYDRSIASSKASSPQGAI